MKTIAVLGMLILAAGVSAQTTGEPQGGAQPDRRTGRSVLEGAKENAREGKDAAGKSLSELKTDVKKGANAVADKTKKATRATKRRVAVALCNDGAYSYTRTNTCSDHGGIKERLKK